jgi:hypothetical protein
MAVAVNDRVRVEPGADGELVVVAAWFGKCGCESMPDRRGFCLWCGSVIVDESSLSARAMLSQLAERGNGHGAGLEEAEAVGAAMAAETSRQLAEKIRAATRSEREPQTEAPAGPTEPAVKRPVSSPSPATDEAASRSEITHITELLRVIELLDAMQCNCDKGSPYMDVMVWEDGSGQDDQAAAALFRRLLCQELISHAPEDIAAAVLSRLDAFGGEST